MYKYINMIFINDILVNRYQFWFEKIWNLDNKLYLFQKGGG